MDAVAKAELGDPGFDCLADAGIAVATEDEPDLADPGEQPRPGPTYPGLGPFVDVAGVGNQDDPGDRRLISGCIRVGWRRRHEVLP